MTTHPLERHSAAVPLHPIGSRAWRRAVGLMSLRDRADRYRDRNGLPPLPADL